jgi:hypothetical protein
MFLLLSKVTFVVNKAISPKKPGFYAAVVISSKQNRVFGQEDVTGNGAVML